MPMSAEDPRAPRAVRCAARGLGSGRAPFRLGALVFAFWLLATAVVAAPAAADPAPQARWTVMVYMAGDNDLEKWVARDIGREMAAVGSNADVQVVVLADRAPGYATGYGDWTGTLLFHVTEGMTATPDQALADWGERDMGSPQTLIDFVSWARAGYPADRYALFLWDHGWGWWPGNTMADETSNDYLDMDELRDALEVVGGVDMVGMDTCMPQMVEVQAEFRGFAKAMAGSQDAIGYTGFAFDRVLAGLQADPAMGASALATLAAKSMRSGHDKWTAAASAVGLGRRWDALAAAVSDLGWDLASTLRGHRAAYAAARRRSARLPQATYPEVRDLFSVAKQIKARASSKTVRRDCDRVIAALRRTVLYEWHTKAEGDLHGISIFWPAAPAPPRRGASFSQWVDFPYYCSQLTFARLTYWSDFLVAWGR